MRLKLFTGWDTGIGKFLRSILFRLLLFNVLLVFLPVAAVLYLDTFENQLLRAQEKSMVQQGRIFSASLSNQGPLNRSKAETILSNLKGRTETRIRIIDSSGNLYADSSTLFYAGSSEADKVKKGRYEESVSFLDEDSFLYRTATFPVRIYRKLFKPPIPVAPESYYNSNKPFNGEEIRAALRGRYGAVTRLSSGGQRSVTLYTAIPIFDSGHVIGAVLCSQSTYRILKDLYEMRLVILKVFLASFFAAVLISLFLYYTIAFRIRRLQADAESITTGRGKIKGSFKPSGFMDEIGYLSLSLKRLTDRLDNYIRYMDSFISDFSHEFKNPLAVVRSASEMIPETSGVRQVRFLQLIDQNTRRMEMLLGGIREFALINKGLEERNREPVDLVSLLTDLLDGFMIRFSNRRWFFEKKVSFVMKASKEYISRIFINILENGVSFSPDMGVIRISMEEREGKVHIRIFNEGPAIAENDLEKIFCRFYSSRLEDKDLHPGLGLAIVRTITESYGGEVKAKNVQGGVLFTVSFPKPLV